MAPMTCRRAHDNYTGSDLIVEYYAQRASIPGTLLILEAVATSPRAAVWQNTSGIYTPDHMLRWRPIVDAVHAQESFIFYQLWIAGRAARPQAVAAGAEVVSSSDVPWNPEEATPRPLREDEIWACIEGFRQAAVNAATVSFDGVEIHGANGCLVDQFTQDTCNRRTDAWEGSIEKRARFGIELPKALVAAIGAEKVGFRIVFVLGLQTPRSDISPPRRTFLWTKVADKDQHLLHEMGAGF
jgi:2,4-dienoyl-CoA reductase-like NADH-dependent reductase (Old Yellow Enzyme family)